MKYLKFVFIVLVAMLIILTACTPAAEETPAEEAAPAEEEAAPAEEEEAPMEEESHTLILAMGMEDLITLDPAWAGETTNQLIHANTYDTLIEYDPSDFNTPLPKLAESWEAAEGAQEFTFTLKEGLVFSSGNPITSKDVEFSWLRGKYMQNWFFDPIDSFEIIDDRTFTVKLQYPSADFYAIVTIPGLGITDSEAIMAQGGTMAEDAYETDEAKLWLDQNSAGSAPYIMTSWAQKAEVVFEANPNYWGEQPYFDRVILKHVEDPTTMVQLLEKGDADIVPNIDIDLVETVEADADLKLVVSQTQDMNYLAMTSNCATEIGPETATLLCQPDVRKAVVYGIDYDGLIQAVLKGYGTRAPTILPIGMPGVDPAEVEGRDVEKAKQYLADAGYADGITLDLYYAQNPTRDTIAAKIKNDLEEINITINLNPLEVTVYLDQMRSQKLPFAFGGWTPDYMDVTLWTDYYSSIENGVAYRMWYDNPRAAELKDLIKSTVDPDMRVEYVKELQQIWKEDMPFTMLYQNQTIAAMASDLQGYEYHPARRLNIYNLYK